MYSLLPIFSNIASKALPKISNAIAGKAAPILFSKAGKIIDWAANKFGGKLGISQDTIRRQGYKLTNKLGRNAMKYGQKKALDFGNNMKNKFIKYQQKKRNGLDIYGRKIQNLNNILRQQLDLAKMPQVSQGYGVFDPSNNTQLYNRIDPKRARQWQDQEQIPESSKRIIGQRYLY